MKSKLARSVWNSFPLALLVLLSGSEASIKFYSDVNHEGLFYESNARVEDGCINLPFGNDQLSSINTGGECVTLFEDGSCQGGSIQVMPGSHSHNNLEMHQFNDKASSFSVCQSWSAPKHPVVGLYDDIHHRNLLAEYNDLCGCTNLPEYANDKVSAINSHGNCIVVYEHGNCAGDSREIKPDVNVYHGDLTGLGFNDKISSIRRCDQYSGCDKLNALVTKFRFTSNLQELLQEGNLQKVELATSSSFVNHASTTISKTYEASKRYRELLLFERVDSLSKMDSVGVDFSVGIEQGFEIPLLSKTTLKAELKRSVQRQTTAGSQHKGQYSSEHSRFFTVRETFTVPACSVYDVSSFMLVRENMPLSYELEVELTGRTYGRELNANELIARIPAGMELVRTINNQKVLAKTRGRIVANMGVKSKVEAHQRRIPGCS